MEQTPRIRNLIAEELGKCCDADVEQRLTELDALIGDTPDDYTSDLDTLKALGNDTRYTIIRLLVAADDERCVCEFAPLLDVSESAVSHALAELVDAGLVTRRKDGTWRYYKATARAEQLIAALDVTREATT